MTNENRFELQPRTELERQIMQWEHENHTNFGPNARKIIEDVSPIEANSKPVLYLILSSLGSCSGRRLTEFLRPDVLDGSWIALQNMVVDRLYRDNTFLCRMSYARIQNVVFWKLEGNKPETLDTITRNLKQGYFTGNVDLFKIDDNLYSALGRPLAQASIFKDKSDFALKSSGIIPV